MVYRCDNCGDNDPANVEHFAADDVYICVCCGLSVHHYCPIREDEYLVGCDKPRRCYRKSYARKTHLVERLSMARMAEPVICKEHKRIIKDEFGKPEFQKRYRERGYKLKKDDVKELLRSIDARKEHKRKFSTTYLEKWKSIRKTLLKHAGWEEKKMEPTAVVKIGTTFAGLSNIWDVWQNAEKRRDEWKFPERKHFPNFNATILRLHEIHGIPCDPEEWPEPASKTSHKYINALFAAANLPIYEKYKVYSNKNE